MSILSRATIYYLATPIRLTAMLFLEVQDRWRLRRAFGRKPTEKEIRADRVLQRIMRIRNNKLRDVEDGSIR